jgi:hypothetical protein
VVIQVQGEGITRVIFAGGRMSLHFRGNFLQLTETDFKQGKDIFYGLAGDNHFGRGAGFSFCPGRLLRQVSRGFGEAAHRLPRENPFLPKVLFPAPPARFFPGTTRREKGKGLMKHVFTFFLRLLVSFLAAKFLTHHFGLEGLGYWLALTLAFLANIYFFDYLNYRGHAIFRRRL